MAQKTAPKKNSAPTTPIDFSAEVERLGERLIVRLPEAASKELPSRGQVAVNAKMNDHAFDTVLEPDGKKGHWISVDAALEKALDLDDGTEVSATVTPTKEWPEPEVPEDLRAALDAAPELIGTWEDITPMARWEWVRWIGATKSAATREKRVGVTIDKLDNGKRRPCCFDLSSCTDPELSKSGKLVDSL